METQKSNPKNKEEVKKSSNLKNTDLKSGKNSERAIKKSPAKQLSLK